MNADDSRSLTPCFALEFIKSLMNDMQETEIYIVSESWWQHTTLDAYCQHCYVNVDRHPDKGGIEPPPENSQPKFRCSVGGETEDFWVPQTWHRPLYVSPTAQTSSVLEFSAQQNQR